MPPRRCYEAVEDYIAKTNRKVMFEYVLIKGVNDSDEQAKELAKLMDKKLYFLNLILYNPSAGSGQAGTYKASDTKRVEGFKKVLTKAKINFSQRYRFGDDINAACGQFITSK